MDERQIAEEAQHWFEELNSGPGPRPRAEFAQWLKRSPRNVQHFLFATALDRSLGAIDAERKLDVEQMIAEAAKGVTALRDESPARQARLPRHRKTFRPIVALAATLAFAAFVLWQFLPRSSASYTTLVGEQRAFQLEDGSLLQLNTASRVRVNLSDRARDIELLEGEALFNVAPDPARPFRVHAGDSVIRALGTRFNVYRKNNGVAVSVLEGKVAVDSGGSETVLSAGEEARLADGKLSQTASADLASTVAWRQRRLVFKVTPLGEVVSEFNRYNRSLKLRMEGIEGNSRHYTGTFDADDPESLAQLLSQDHTLSVEHAAGEIVIRQR